MRPRMRSVQAERGAGIALELGSLAAVGRHGGPPAVDRRCRRRRRPLGVFQGERQRRVEDAPDAGPGVARPHVEGAACPFRVRPEPGDRLGLRRRRGRRGGRGRRRLGGGQAVRGQPSHAGERRGGRSRRGRRPGPPSGRSRSVRRQAPAGPHPPEVVPGFRTGRGRSRHGRQLRGFGREDNRLVRERSGTGCVWKKPCGAREGPRCRSSDGWCRG